jgi:hypothetical protein
MPEPLVLHSLRCKRPKMSGQIHASRKRLEQLTRSLEHLDNTLRLFDPDAKLATIKTRTLRITARLVSLHLLPGARNESPRKDLYSRAIEAAILGSAQCYAEHMLT